MTITPHDCWLLPGEDDTSRMTAYRELFCDPLSQADIEYTVQRRHRPADR